MGVSPRHGHFFEICRHYDVRVRWASKAALAAQRVRGYACCRWRTITISPIGSLDDVATAWHELGHLVSGPCPGTEPHRKDPRQKNWHHCIMCEIEAWNRAMALSPVWSADMHAHLRESLLVYRASTPASRAAIADLDRLAGSLTFRSHQLKQALGLDYYRARLARAMKGDTPHHATTG